MRNQRPAPDSTKPGRRNKPGPSAALRATPAYAAGSRLGERGSGSGGRSSLTPLHLAGTWARTTSKEPIFRGLPAKLRERVQGDLVSLWQEMLSLNAALAEVADEFGGEDSPQADNAG
jgi:hypothetical protein